MSDRKAYWVFSEKASLLVELITGARWLAKDARVEIHALVLGTLAEAKAALAFGADCVLWLGELKAGYMPEDYVPTLERMVGERSPEGMLIGATTCGRAIAGRLAARLDLTVLTDVKQFSFATGQLQVEHMIFGGGAVRIEKPSSKMFLATAGPGTFEASPSQDELDGDLVEIPFVEPEWRFKLLEHREVPPAVVDLAKAKKVVCAGRGLARQEDLALVKELADAMGAEVACTRPLAEGLDWLPRERYVGISGANIHPDLYLGIGVSGQVQHTVGMNDSRLVVAINKDAQAPIFTQVDYGIVGDLYSMVPALIKALKATTR